MVEPFINAARNHLNEPARQARRFFLWLCFGSSGFLITALVVVLVGARFLWLWSNHSRYDKIADAFGSVGYLYGAPQSSRSGDQITFVQTSPNGVGVWLCDTATGRKQLVAEENGREKEYYQDVAVWPWSPDDRLFVHTRNDLSICLGDTGDEVARFKMGNQPVDALAWLTPRSFAYASPNGNLHLVSRQKGTNWQQSQLAGVKVRSASFTALSSNTVAWNQANCIMAMDLDSKAVARLYQVSAGQTLDAFDYSKDTGKFLLKLRQANQVSLWQLMPGNDPVKIADCQPGTGAISWLDPTNGKAAYLNPKSFRSSEQVLTLQSGSPAKSNTLFAHGAAEAFTASPDGRHFFIVGVVSNEPAAGIWQYDIFSGKLSCPVPCSDHPLPYARHVEALQCTLTLASGRRVGYFLYPPVNFNRKGHKKYPLVIGDTVYQVGDAENQGRVHGPLWAEAVACCDAYVVIVNRSGWFAGLNEWETNVTDVYQHLAKNPTIDADRVFLFGASAETGSLSKLAQDRPELWKGLLLLNPSMIPQFAEMPPGKPVPKMLISVGEAEKKEAFLKWYKTEARQNAEAVTVIIHPNSNHWLISVDALRARTKAIVDLIFDN